MEKYIKFTCLCCGWYTHVANPRHPQNTFVKDRVIESLACEKCKFKKCLKCPHLTKDISDIKFVSPLAFDEGLG